METSSKSQEPAAVDFAAPGAAPTAVGLRDRLVLLLKFLLVGFVFFFLYRKGLVTPESFRKLFASPRTWGICTVLTLLNALFGALRWQVLLRTQGVELGLKEVFRLNLIGMFFNIALPGAVSGDLVKAMILMKDHRKLRAGIFGSLVFDRILGVSAMVFVGAFSALLSVLVPWGGALPGILLLTIGGVGAGAALFFLYLFVSHRRDPLFTFLRIFTSRHERLGSIERFYQGVMGYRAFPRRVLKAILLSVLIHLFLIMVSFLIAETISTEGLSFFAIAVIVPIGMLATAIPVLPAGVGTGHAAFLGLFHLVGSAQGAEVFSLIVLYQVMMGVLGGFVYLRHLASVRNS